MTARISDLVAKITHFIHKYFLPLLLVSYVLAGAGLALRQLSLGSATLPGLGQINLSISLVMLSFLLFNAGLGIQTKELIGLRKRPLILAAGFLGNILVPILLVLSFHGLLAKWHNPDELQNMLVGFALIAAMPIAGSSGNSGRIIARKAQARSFRYPGLCFIGPIQSLLSHMSQHFRGFIFVDRGPALLER
jgi:bile acid:Na+ symporter, BASS family